MAYNLKKAFRISRLLAKYQSEGLTGPESQELENWISKSAQNRELFDKMVSEENQENYEKWKSIDPRAPHHRMQVRIAEHRKMRRRSIVLSLLSTGVAACLLLVLLLPFNKPTTIPSGIYPGESKAKLILSDGKVHNLDASSSIYLNESGVAISKGNETPLSYNVNSDKQAEGKLVYNEIRVERGGEFDLELADGTHVWLNSESSLRYPVAFTGNERRVYFTGEAYFEVAKDLNKQFVVESDGQTAYVLGTSFNITAYPGSDKIVTTLISGKLSVSHGEEDPIILLPGEQSRLDSESGVFSVSNVDIVDAIAWRTGWFILNNQTLEEFITQVSRWYDFEITFINEKAREMEFVGRVPRYGDFDEVLDVLRKSSDLKITVKDKFVYIE